MVYTLKRHSTIYHALQDRAPPQPQNLMMYPRRRKHTGTSMMWTSALNSDWIICLPTQNWPSRHVSTLSKHIIYPCVMHCKIGHLHSHKI